MSASSLMPVDDALALLLEHVEPLTEVETVSLFDARGRVLAEDQHSAVDVPPADNSEMDGYAISYRAYAAGQTRFPVSQRVTAGAVASPLEAGTAARIFTGAFMPPGADTVVMQENCEADGDQVEILVPPTPGQSVRRRAQDIAMDALAVSKGTILQAGHLGLLASVGVASVSVYRRLKVAVLQTGDELAEPGHALAPGAIYNSNRYLLNSLLEDLGFEVIDCGRIPDSPSATRSMLKEAATRADVVITTGGVSVGEEDHVKGAVNDLGELALWKIALKPGKPLAFGRVGTAAFFGLPGNPSSVFVTLQVIARPWLLARQGVVGAKHLETLHVKAGFDWPKPGTRREFLRARLVDSDLGVEAHLYTNQSSGVLSSVAWSNCLAVIREGTTVTKGDLIPVLMTRLG